ncbi:hypothetical protein ACTWJ9_04730 [Streptomyces sp. GDS52]|uniref:Integral membrane protein n=1 Tax=Streptomyces cathayae TaxID=3031124 RepID=A0ABY8JV72_9ACTN|nr:hypothetical protein [Streptomyces sp. HUAS 5]WGD39887.1 hypothetical protein PYS65_06925 [Streptomyces sp. HUAS 5]
MREHRTGCAGMLLAAAGAITAVLAWAPKARVSVDGGFAGMHRDLSVLYVDLPLIAVGGALVPLTAWLLTLRALRRPWLAAVIAAGALALGVWGLLSWWTPYQQPEFMGQPRR